MTKLVRRFRFPLMLVVLWGTVALVPALRAMWTAQRELFDFVSHGDEVQSLIAMRDKLAQREARTIDEQVAALCSFDDNLRPTANRQSTAAYDALIARYPGRAWLLAARLRDCSRWMRDDRLAGAWEYHRIPMLEIERSLKPPNFSAVELEQALQVARAGHALEPDNAYFHWMMVWLLYAGYRDAEAHQVIFEGANAGFYDDHRYDLLRILVRVHRIDHRITHRERAQLQWSIPDSGEPRYHLVALVTWNAWKLERAGRHLEALRLREAMLRLCDPMMRGRNAISTGFRAMNYRKILWTGDHQRLAKKAAPARAGLPNTTQSYSQLAAERYMAYTTARGHPELARRAQADLAAMKRYRAADAAVPGLYDGFGLSRSLFARLYTHHLLGLLAFGQAVLSFVLLIVFTLLALPGRGIRAPQVERRDWHITIGASVATYALVAVAHAFYFRYLMGQPTWDSSDLDHLVFGNAVALLAPPCCGALVCALFTNRRLARRQASSLHRSQLDRLAPDRRPAVFAFVEATLGMAALGCIVTAACAVTADSYWDIPLPGGNRHAIYEPWMAFSYYALGILSLLYGAWLIRWRWWGAPASRPARLYALLWHRETLKRWVIVSSILYLLQSFATLPAWNEGHRYMDLELERGKVALMLQPASEVAP